MDSKDSARHTTKTGVMHPGTTLTDAIRQWPSPQATWGEAGNKSRSGARQDEMLIGAMAREVSKQWATPRAEDSESAGMRHGRGVADTLTAQVRNTTWDRNQYPTPTAQDYGTSQNGKDHERPSNGTPSLSTWARNWATPTTSDHTGPKKSGNKRGGGRKLNEDAALFPTPAARDYRTPNAESFQERSGTTKGEQLPNFVAHCFRPVQTTLNSGPASSSDTQNSHRRLNPIFVEWLMGWPAHYTRP